MTSSLISFLLSLFWGSLLVIFPILTALLYISQADVTARKFV